MRDAVAVETLKARRSRLPWATAAAFAVATLVAGMFMFIVQNPDRARSLGLLGAKAQLAGGSADWPSYLALLAQTTAVGGVAIFGVILIWTFGREFTDRTAKDLLALPTPRTSIVAAKFAVAGVWCVLLSLETYVLGLAVGAVLRLPDWSVDAAWQGLGRLLATTAMTWWLVTVLAFAASVGRGYLPAIGVMFLILFLAQVIAALGYGHLFPWSVPAIYAGLAGPDRAPPGPPGYVLVALTGAGGIVATLLWWREADQSR